MVRAVCIIRGAVGVLAFGCLLFGAGLATASEWKKPPFDLSFDVYLSIPDDLGAAFFHDVWLGVSGRQGGGPLTITPEVIANYESSMPVKESPYRVLYTGPNYVLFLEKFYFDHDEAQSSFGVFSLLNSKLGSKNPYKRWMRLWTCTDHSMRNGAAYDWPIEKIEETLWSGLCAKGLDIPFKDWKSLNPDWWSSGSYSRLRE
ncbi:MAG: hypothetical protein HQ501_00830 [Rhodospirillales bacterium]|nr:hypothetical protein [Rhodospirillales bacterium]